MERSYQNGEWVCSRFFRYQNEINSMFQLVLNLTWFFPWMMMNEWSFKYYWRLKRCTKIKYRKKFALHPSSFHVSQLKMDHQITRQNIGREVLIRIHFDTKFCRIHLSTENLFLRSFGWNSSSQLDLNQERN